MILYKQLVAQLRVWWQQKEDFFLHGDFNKHAYNGRSGQRLAQDDIGMFKQCLATTKTLTSYTHLWIQSHWHCNAMQGAVLINTTILQNYGGVGDHHCFIIDFTSESVLGGIFPRTLASSKRKLHCDYERIWNNYNSVLSELANRHQLFKKLNGLDDIAKVLTEAEFQLHTNWWDNKLMEYMKASENKCHKFNSFTGK